jgi:hypothetical protein
LALLTTVRYCVFNLVVNYPTIIITYVISTAKMRTFRIE